MKIYITSAIAATATFLLFLFCILYTILLIILIIILLLLLLIFAVVIAELFICQMPFLLPSQQCQIT